ncbi:MAG: hypothetical protein ACOCUQ_03330 [Bacteroidota bacterium]
MLGFGTSLAGMCLVKFLFGNTSPVIEMLVYGYYRFFGAALQMLLS